MAPAALPNRRPGAWPPTIGKLMRVKTRPEACPRQPAGAAGASRCTSAPAARGCSSHHRQSRRCRAHTRTCARGQGNRMAGGSATAPCSSQQAHVPAGVGSSGAVPKHNAVRSMRQRHPKPSARGSQPSAPHSLKRRVRQGMTRARCAMMDMRCSEGWRLNSTTSPSATEGRDRERLQLIAAAWSPECSIPRHAAARPPCRSRSNIIRANHAPPCG